MNNVILGIDISSHNGSEIDFNAVKNDGVKFVIIRAGYGKYVSQKDKCFEHNYSECKKHNIPVGCYWYSYATTVAEAEAEASAFIEVIKGKTFEYPVYYDIEEKEQFNTGKTNVTAMAKAFCEKLEKAGYFVGIYCSTYFLTNYFTESIRNRYAIWVAEYNTYCKYSGNYGIWQCNIAGHPKYDYLERKNIKGVAGQCDMNYCYIDYPSIIKNAGLNNTKNITESNNTESKNEKIIKLLNEVITLLKE